MPVPATPNFAGKFIFYMDDKGLGNIKRVFFGESFIKLEYGFGVEKCGITWENYCL
jgi:hypothetical protein